MDDLSQVRFVIFVSSHRVIQIAACHLLPFLFSLFLFSLDSTDICTHILLLRYSNLHHRCARYYGFTHHPTTFSTLPSSWPKQ